MSMMEEFNAHVEAGRWPQALDAVDRILERRPEIATSWFNRGVCLDELGRHGEAAAAFLHAYELDPVDLGCQYRRFRSLYLADDLAGFVAFASEEAESLPEVLGLLEENNEFSRFVATPQFQALRSPAFRAGHLASGVEEIDSGKSFGGLLARIRKWLS